MHLHQCGLVVIGLSLLGALTTCSLKTHSPYAIVVVGAPATPAKRAIASRQCFGLFVTGEGSEVTAAEIGMRTPTCFGMSGKYMGAYSYADLTNGTAKITLAFGSHKLTLLALDKSADCTNRDLSYFFPNSDTGVAVTYPVGNSGDVVVNANTTKIEVAPTLYTEAVDLSAVCPRDGNVCNGAAVCDTFTSPDGTIINARMTEVGSTLWTVSGFPSSGIISEGRAIASASSGNSAQFLVFSTSRDTTVSALITHGSYGFNGSDISLIGRYSDPSNYVEGNITRNAASYCLTSISERIGGINTIRVSSTLYACDSGPLPTRLVMNGAYLELTHAGVTIQYDSGSAALAGTYVGFSSEAAGAPLAHIYIDNFAATDVVRRHP